MTRSTLTVTAILSFLAICASVLVFTSGSSVNASAGSAAASQDFRYVSDSSGGSSYACSDLVNNRVRGDSGTAGLTVVKDVGGKAISKTLMDVQGGTVSKVPEGVKDKSGRAQQLNKLADGVGAMMQSESNILPDSISSASSTLGDEVKNDVALSEKAGNTADWDVMCDGLTPFSPVVAPLANSPALNSGLNFIRYYVRSGYSSVCGTMAYYGFSRENVKSGVKKTVGLDLDKSSDATTLFVVVATAALFVVCSAVIISRVRKPSSPVASPISHALSQRRQGARDRGGDVDESQRREGARDRGGDVDETTESGEREIREIRVSTSGTGHGAAPESGANDSPARGPRGSANPTAAVATRETPVDLRDENPAREARSDLGGSASPAVAGSASNTEQLSEPGDEDIEHKALGMLQSLKDLSQDLEELNLSRSRLPERVSKRRSKQVQHAPSLEECSDVKESDPEFDARQVFDPVEPHQSNTEAVASSVSETPVKDDRGSECVANPARGAACESGSDSENEDLRQSKKRNTPREEVIYEVRPRYVLRTTSMKNEFSDTPTDNMVSTPREGHPETSLPFEETRSLQPVAEKFEQVKHVRFANTGQPDEATFTGESNVKDTETEQLTEVVETGQSGEETRTEQLTDEATGTVEDVKVADAVQFDEAAETVEDVKVDVKVADAVQFDEAAETAQPAEEKFEQVQHESSFEEDSSVKESDPVLSKFDERQVFDPVEPHQSFTGESNVKDTNTEQPTEVANIEQLSESGDEKYNKLIQRADRVLEFMEAFDRKAKFNEDSDVEDTKTEQPTEVANIEQHAEVADAVQSGEVTETAQPAEEKFEQVQHVPSFEEYSSVKESDPVLSKFDERQVFDSVEPHQSFTEEGNVKDTETKQPTEEATRTAEHVEGDDAVQPGEAAEIAQPAEEKFEQVQHESSFEEDGSVEGSNPFLHEFNYSQGLEEKRSIKEAGVSPTVCLTEATDTMKHAEVAPGKVSEGLGPTEIAEVWLDQLRASNEVSLVELGEALEKQVNEDLEKTTRTGQLVEVADVVKPKEATETAKPVEENFEQAQYDESFEADSSVAESDSSLCESESSEGFAYLEQLSDSGDEEYDELMQRADRALEYMKAFNYQVTFTEGSDVEDTKTEQLTEVANIEQHAEVADAAKSDEATMTVQPDERNEEERPVERDEAIYTVERDTAEKSEVSAVYSDLAQGMVRDIFNSAYEQIDQLGYGDTAPVEEDESKAAVGVVGADFVDDSMKALDHQATFTEGSDVEDTETWQHTEVADDIEQLSSDDEEYDELMQRAIERADRALGYMKALNYQFTEGSDVEDTETGQPAEVANIEQHAEVADAAKFEEVAETAQPVVEKLEQVQHVPSFEEDGSVEESGPVLSKFDESQVFDPVEPHQSFTGESNVKDTETKQPTDEATRTVQPDERNEEEGPDERDETIHTVELDERSQTAEKPLRKPMFHSIDDNAVAWNRGRDEELMLPDQRYSFVYQPQKVEGDTAEKSEVIAAYSDLAEAMARDIIKSSYEKIDQLCYRDTAPVEEDESGAAVGVVEADFVADSRVIYKTGSQSEVAGVAQEKNSQKVGVDLEESLSPEESAKFLKDMATDVRKMEQFIVEVDRHGDEYERFADLSGRFGLDLPSDCFDHVDPRDKPILFPSPGIISQDDMFVDGSESNFELASFYAKDDYFKLSKPDRPNSQVDEDLSDEGVDYRIHDLGLEQFYKVDSEFTPDEDKWDCEYTRKYLRDMYKHKSIFEPVRTSPELRPCATTIIGSPTYKHPRVRASDDFVAPSNPSPSGFTKEELLSSPLPEIQVSDPEDGGLDLPNSNIDKDCILMSGERFEWSNGKKQVEEKSDEVPGFLKGDSETLTEEKHEASDKKENPVSFAETVSRGDEQDDVKEVKNDQTPVEEPEEVERPYMLTTVEDIEFNLVKEAAKVEKVEEFDDRPNPVGESEKVEELNAAALLSFGQVKPDLATPTESTNTLSFLKELDEGETAGNSKKKE